VPKEWNGRRVAIEVEYLNSYAAVFVDGTKRGELHFRAANLISQRMFGRGAHTF